MDLNFSTSSGGPLALMLSDIHPDPLDGISGLLLGQGDRRGCRRSWGSLGGLCLGAPMKLLPGSPNPPPKHAP